MDPALDENHDSGNVCGSGNAYCWNDMAAKSGNAQFPEFAAIVLILYSRKYAA
jgi:hypothetical protein